MIAAAMGTMIFVEILMNKNFHGLTIASGVMICYRQMQGRSRRLKKAKGVTLTNGR